MGWLRMIDISKLDFLDFVHLRDAIRRSGTMDSALVMAADGGLGALLLALEYPKIQFHLAVAIDPQRFIRFREIVSD